MARPKPSRSEPICTALEAILGGYERARAGETFGRAHPLWNVFRELQTELSRAPAVAARATLEIGWSAGAGSWARVPWVALLDGRETRTPRQGVHCVYLFREDLSGVYLALNQGVTEPKRQLGGVVARVALRRRAADLRELCDGLLPRGFQLDDLVDLRTEQTTLGRDYEASVIAHKLYEAGAVPGDAVLAEDLEALLATYDRYLRARRSRVLIPGALAVREPRRVGYAVRPEPGHPDIEPWNPERAVAALTEYVERRHFVFEPWAIAAYVTALRTKPFCVLAGVSGTGKSRLPQLVAEGTGGVARLVPVRPDWTDGSEALGYSDLGGSFRPGAVLEIARQAWEHPARQHVCVLDEMNLARPEHYFAEVLSRIEDRRAHPAGGFTSPPLLGGAGVPEPWREIGLAPNLAVVGTVNMDESAHTFSRKVLDRAFTLELSDVELLRWQVASGPTAADPVPEAARWPMHAWHPRATQLGTLDALSSTERERVQAAVEAVAGANPHLAPAGLQAGYRTRDEVALFVLHADPITGSFRTRSDEPVDPLDLALAMKLLPRILGGSAPVRRALLGLLGWSHTGQPFRTDAEARASLDSWDNAGRPGALRGARFPRTAARLCLMWERMLAEGFTSFWA